MSKEQIITALREASIALLYIDNITGSEVMYRNVVDAHVALDDLIDLLKYGEGNEHANP